MDDDSIYQTINTNFHNPTQFVYDMHTSDKPKCNQHILN